MMERVAELRAFRQRQVSRRGGKGALTMEEAAAMVVGADGTSPNRSTWHAWEHGRKVPAPNFMSALCELVGASADIFFPSGSSAAHRPSSRKAAAKLGTRSDDPQGKIRRPFGAIHRHGFVRVAAATPVASAGDIVFNVDQALALAKRAADRGVDLVVFPELNISSYAVDDLHLQEAFLDEVELGLARLAEASAKLAPVLVVGAPVRRNGRLYNCGIALSRGRILGAVPKSFLPNYREYYEKRWFASGIGLEG